MINLPVFLSLFEILMMMVCFNFRDIDSDQDGLSDTREASGNDTDADGRIDVFVDVNRDGLADSYVENRVAPRDTDGDRIPDYIDSDSDNDGIPDADEGGTAPSMPQPDSSAPLVDSGSSDVAAPDNTQPDNTMSNADDATTPRLACHRQAWKRIGWL